MIKWLRKLLGCPIIIDTYIRGEPTIYVCRCCELSGGLYFSTNPEYPGFCDLCRPERVTIDVLKSMAQHYNDQVIGDGK